MLSQAFEQNTMRLHAKKVKTTGRLHVPRPGLTFLSLVSSQFFIIYQATLIAILPSLISLSFCLALQAALDCAKTVQIQLQLIHCRDTPREAVDSGMKLLLVAVPATYIVRSECIAADNDYRGE